MELLVIFFFLMLLWMTILTYRLNIQKRKSQQLGSENEVQKGIIKALKIKFISYGKESEKDSSKETQERGNDSD